MMRGLRQPTNHLLVDSGLTPTNIVHQWHTNSPAPAIYCIVIPKPTPLIYTKCPIFHSAVHEKYSRTSVSLSSRTSHQIYLLQACIIGKYYYCNVFRVWRETQILGGHTNF